MKHQIMLQKKNQNEVNNTLSIDSIKKRESQGGEKKD